MRRAKQYNLGSFNITLNICNEEMRNEGGGNKEMHSHATVQVHAAYGGRVSIQRVHALTSVCVPHLQCAVSRATDDEVAGHL